MTDLHGAPAGTLTDVVFAGPSVYGVAPEAFAGVTLAPPIKAGDLAALPGGAGGARRIFIVDGEFGQSLSVTVREIREALRRGDTVIGCSSMGALRAAECGPIGMRGFGWVYERYASGEVTADEEVALCFDPDTGAPVTVPTVNVRWLASTLLRDGTLSPAQALAWVDLARGIFFRDRSPGRLARAARRELDRGSAELFCSWLAEERLVEWDRKRLDALETLAAHRVGGLAAIA